MRQNMLITRELIHTAAIWGDRSLCPLPSKLLLKFFLMAHAQEAPLADNGDSDVIDLCSVSSCDGDGQAVGSPSVDSAATLSEASDAGPAAAGARLMLC